MKQQTEPEKQISLDVLSQLGKAYCLFDENLLIQGWNDQLESFGVPATAVVGKNLFEVMTVFLSLDSDALEKAVQDCCSQASTIKLGQLDFSFPANNNMVFQVSVAPIGRTPFLGMMMLEDVTESVKSQRQFERILDSTPDGVFVIDANRKLQFFNKSCEYITGRHLGDLEIQNCSCSEIIQCHTAEGESASLNSCPAKGVFRGDYQHDREEMLVTNSDGQERWIETTYSPVLDSRGDVEYVVGILRDVHDRKLLEERLYQSEKLASLGHLTAGIAHEIKNPLAILLSSLDVLQNPDRRPEDREQAGAFMREEIKRLDERIKSFLNFARPKAFRPVSLVLSSLIRRRIDVLQGVLSRITLITEFTSPDPIIAGDEMQLDQLLTNLIFNASDAMEGEGEVVIRASQKADTAILEVEDSGPGVPEENICQIFDPFYTTRADGTGLGLSICYQIVLAHRGTISVTKPKNGIGACFSIRFPMALQV